MRFANVALSSKLTAILTKRQAIYSARYDEHAETLLIIN